MNPSDIRTSAEQRMVRAIEALRQAFTRIRSGRAHAGLLEHVQVEYYGSMVPITQVATVSVIDARTLGVSVWERKMAQAVDRAIREADLGLNPVMTGDALRVPMPPLSEERRRELVKVVKSEAEQAKVAVRNLRRDANDQLRKLQRDKLISEDEERRAQDDTQKMTDRYIGEIDKVVAGKEQELMSI